MMLSECYFLMNVMLYINNKLLLLLLLLLLFLLLCSTAHGI